MRILYVEDTDAYVKILERVAEHLKYELRVAATGAEALKLLSPDLKLILTDVGLPDMDGFDMIRQIRAQLPDTPVVAFTARVMPGEREQCLEAGCTEYVPKPIGIPDLIALLKRYDV
jgi:CheY-like chemotaxis protein